MYPISLRFLKKLKTIMDLEILQQSISSFKSLTEKENTSTVKYKVKTSNLKSYLKGEIS